MKDKKLGSKVGSFRRQIGPGDVCLLHIVDENIGRTKITTCLCWQQWSILNTILILIFYTTKSH